MSFFVDTQDEAVREVKMSSRFVVPEGSLLQFPESVEAVHIKEDFNLFPLRDWLCTTQAHTLELMHDVCRTQTCNWGLAEQKEWVEDHGYSLLLPYDIAYLAALWKKEGRGRLFTGRVRTEAWGLIAQSHLSLGQSTLVAMYDKNDQLRFEVQYPRFAAVDLAVLAGIYS